MDNKKRKGNEFDYDLILSSLIYSSFHPGGIKSIYEREEQETFGEKLNIFIKKKKSEIQGICDDNYEVFLKSVNKLRDARDGTIFLKKGISDLESSIQLPGLRILDSGKRILENQNTYKNICGGLNIVKYCYFISSLCVKATEHISEKQYYKAIMTLHRVQKALKRIKKYNFVKYMEDSIPKLLKQVKTEIENEFNAWLSFVRLQSDKIGGFMLQAMQTKLLNHNHTRNTFDTQISVDPTDEIVNISLNAFDKFGIDFTKVYRFQLIYDSLNEETSVYYKNNRETQIEDFFKKFEERYRKDKLNENRLESLRTMLSEVIGFYALERYVLETTSLISKFEVIRQWESKCKKMQAFLMKCFRDTKKKEHFLELKQLIFGFSFTMDKFLGFYSTALIDLIEQFIQKYSRSLLKCYKDQINGYSKEEKKFHSEFYERVDTYEKLKKFQRYVIFEDDLNVASEFEFEEKFSNPIPVYFTKCIPKILKSFEEYIQKYFQYTQYLPWSKGGIEGIEKKVKNGIKDLILECKICFEQKLSLDYNKDNVNPNTPEIESFIIVINNIIKLKNAFTFISKFYLEERSKFQINTEASTQLFDTPWGLNNNEHQKPNEEEKILGMVKVLLGWLESPDKNSTKSLDEKIFNRIKIRIKNEVKIFFQDLRTSVNWIPTEKASNIEFVKSVEDFISKHFEYYKVLPSHYIKIFADNYIKRIEKEYKRLVFKSDEHSGSAMMNLFAIHSFIEDIGMLIEIFKQFNEKNKIGIEKNWKKAFLDVKEVFYFIKKEKVSVQFLNPPTNFENSYLENFEKKYKSKSKTENLKRIFHKLKAFGKANDGKSGKNSKVQNIGISGKDKKTKKGIGYFFQKK